jgi:MFS family permease
LNVDTVGEARVGQAMAYASSAMSIGLILGPVLGGVLYAQKGYYAAFGLAFAFIGLDLILRLILIEKKVALKYAPVIVADQENPPSLKLESPQAEIEGPASTEFRAIPPETAPRANLNVETRSKVPHVIRILKYPRLLVALLVSFLQALILSALDATLPLYLNALFDYTALQAGQGCNVIN